MYIHKFYRDLAAHLHLAVKASCHYGRSARAGEGCIQGAYIYNYISALGALLLKPVRHYPVRRFLKPVTHCHW